MKKTKIWKVIWILGVYSILATVLYLVVLYKVKWEDRDFNKYLYFYSCGDDLCTSMTVQNKYFSKIICEDNVCPYIIDIIDNNLILKKDNTSWIYNYVSGKIINNEFNEYRHLNNDNYISCVEPKINVEKIVLKHINDKSVNPHNVNPIYLKLTEAEEKLNDKNN